MPKYIDFDALGVGMCNPDVFEKKGYAEGWNSLIKILHDAPAADVEPVRHARWVPGEEISRTMIGNEALAIEYKDFYCSSCKRRYKEYVLIYNYCPNCGAKMDKEAEIVKITRDKRSEA